MGEVTIIQTTSYKRVGQRAIMIIQPEEEAHRGHACIRFDPAETLFNIK